MGTVLASLSIDLGSTRLQHNPWTKDIDSESEAFLGSAHPSRTQHSLEKDRAGKCGDFLARFREGTFRTPCVRLVLDRRFWCEHHSLCACCCCVLFPHVHRLHLGDGS